MKRIVKISSHELWLHKYQISLDFDGILVGKFSFCHCLARFAELGEKAETVLKNTESLENTPNTRLKLTRKTSLLHKLYTTSQILDLWVKFINNAKTKLKLTKFKKELLASSERIALKVLVVEVLPLLRFWVQWVLAIVKLFTLFWVTKDFFSCSNVNKLSLC